MQATITYLLTEQAQRAQMMATGQPVARKQTVVAVDVGPEDMDLLDVSADGALSRDVSATVIYGYPALEIAPFGADVLALYRAYVARIKSEEKDKAAKSAAYNADRLNSLIDRYFETGEERNLYDVPSNHPRQPEITAERERRRELAALAAAEKQRIEAAQVASDAAKESEKRVFRKAWVMENGSELVKRQFADHLLCRDALTEMIADAAFAAAGVGSAYAYDTCSDTECPCGSKTLKCVPTHIYERWVAIKTTLPEGSAVEFAKVRECLRETDADGDRVGPYEAGSPVYVAKIKLPCGPFVFDRTVGL